MRLHCFSRSRIHVYHGRHGREFEPGLRAVRESEGHERIQILQRVHAFITACRQMQLHLLRSHTWRYRIPLAVQQVTPQSEHYISPCVGNRMSKTFVPVNLRSSPESRIGLAVHTLVHAHVEYQKNHVPLYVFYVLIYSGPLRNA